MAITNYLGVNGVDHAARDGVLFLDSAVRIAEVRDGASNTLLCGERPPSPDHWFGWWYAGHGFGGGTGAGDVTLGTNEVNETGDPLLSQCEQQVFSFGELPDGNMCNTFRFWSHHPGGAHFAFCDGSVRFFAHGEADLLRDLATRSGSEISQR